MIGQGVDSWARTPTIPLFGRDILRPFASKTRVSIRHDQAMRPLRQYEVTKSKKSVPQEDIDRGEEIAHRPEESHIASG